MRKLLTLNPRFVRSLALLSFALLPALFVPSAKAQVIVQDQGLQEFCGNWGAAGDYTCMGLSGYLVKDDTEQDPNHDIYSFVARAWDTRNDNQYIGDLWLETYTYFNALLDKYEPQAATRWQQTPITFSYSGISVGVTLPAARTDIDLNPNYYSSIKVNYHDYVICCGVFPIPNPGWSEYAVAFDVPQGGSVAINIYLHVRFLGQYGHNAVWSNWTPTFGISLQYPPPPPPSRCPPVC